MPAGVNTVGAWYINSFSLQDGLQLYFRFQSKNNMSRKAKSRSSCAGLQFPVGRIHSCLRMGNYAESIGAAAPVYLAAVMEYLAAEVLELAGNAAHDNKKTMIIPLHLQLAFRNDNELTQLFAMLIKGQGGVLPSIQSVLLTKKTEKKNFFPKKILRNKKQEGKHEGKNGYACQRCDYKSGFKISLNRHEMKTHGMKGRFQCKLCKNTFSTRGEKNKCLKIHEAKHMFECSFCPAKFFWKSSVSRHITNIHERKKKIRPAPDPVSKDGRTGGAGCASAPTDSVARF